MMTPAQFATLKRDIVSRMADELPDEALGELINTMREMLAHYGTKAKQTQETMAAPTVANRNALKVALAQREAAAKKIETDTHPLTPPPEPEPEPETKEAPAEPSKPRQVDTAAAAAHARRIAELRAAKLAARRAQVAKQKAAKPTINPAKTTDKANSITTRTPLLARLEELAKQKDSTPAEQGG